MSAKMKRREFITLLGGVVKEKTMRRFTLLLLVALLGGTDRLAAQETVETRDVTSEVKIEEVIVPSYGHRPLSKNCSLNRMSNVPAP